MSDMTPGIQGPSGGHRSSRACGGVAVRWSSGPASPSCRWPRGCSSHPRGLEPESPATQAPGREEVEAAVTSIRRRRVSPARGRGARDPAHRRARDRMRRPWPPSSPPGRHDLMRTVPPETGSSGSTSTPSGRRYLDFDRLRHRHPGGSTAESLTLDRSSARWRQLPEITRCRSWSTGTDRLDRRPLRRIATHGIADWQ